MHPRWEIDWDALRTARHNLELNWPVTIRLVPSLQFDGYYEISFQPGTDAVMHLISLRPFMSVIQANQSLWHELSHARDAELDVQKDGLITRQLKVRIEKELIKYEARPGERRARRLERRALTHPLITELA